MLRIGVFSKAGSSLLLMNKLYPEIASYLNTLQQTAPLPARRQGVLRELADYISRKHRMDEVAEVIFICTHNSRRSHLAQIWASIAAHYHNVDDFIAFSGGTESTAFHPNAIDALERAGRKIEKPGGKNPVYLVKFSEAHKGVQAFSKKYNDKYNPNRNFCAVLTCDEADAACPLVMGMDQRIALTYEDPKVADGLAGESLIYDERCAQIAIEMFFMMGQVNAYNLR